jgi:hypothetical protein
MDLAHRHPGPRAQRDHHRLRVDGRQALVLAEAALKSLRTGKTVKVEK